MDGNDYILLSLFLFGCAIKDAISAFEFVRGRKWFYAIVYVAFAALLAHWAIEIWKLM